MYKCVYTYIVYFLALVSKFIQFEHTTNFANYLRIGRRVSTCDVFIGLYTYHLGEVLRVQSFKRKYPIVEFFQHKNVLISINMDNSDRAEIQVVIKIGSRLLEGTSMDLVDYKSIIDFSSIPGCYVVYWERGYNM